MGTDRSEPGRPVALVTGASRGIGQAVADALAAEGFRLCLGARDGQALSELAHELESRGAEVLAQELDVRDAASVSACLTALLARFGRLDLLVANAGVGGGQPFAAMDADAVAELVETNFLGVLRTVQAALPAMRRQRSGRIVIVSSVAGEVALPGSALYAATKAGVLRFADGLRRELEVYGLRVTAILPGFVRTDMTRELSFPMPGPKVVARAVLQAYRKGPRRIVVPGYYLPIIHLARLWPGLVDLAGRRVLARSAAARRR